MYAFALFLGFIFQSPAVPVGPLLQVDDRLSVVASEHGFDRAPDHYFDRASRDNRFRASAETRMLADLNATRAHAGLPVLTQDGLLSAVAREHGFDMAVNRYFDHASRDGRTPFDRMRAFGCVYTWAGENIALSPDEPRAYQALLRSPHHLENILQPHFLRVGLAAVRQADGEMVFVQDFTD